MPRGSPLVAFFVVALALKKIALQIRFFSVLLEAGLNRTKKNTDLGADDAAAE